MASSSPSRDHNSATAPPFISLRSAMDAASFANMARHDSSSYLSLARDSFTFERSVRLHPLLPVPQRPAHNEAGEIDVFAAERYFRGEMDHVEFTRIGAVRPRGAVKMYCTEVGWSTPARSVATSKGSRASEKSLVGRSQSRRQNDRRPPSCGSLLGHVQLCRLSEKVADDVAAAGWKNGGAAALEGRRQQQAIMRSPKPEDLGFGIHDNQMTVKIGPGGGSGFRKNLAWLTPVKVNVAVADHRENNDDCLSLDNISESSSELFEINNLFLDRRFDAVEIVKSPQRRPLAAASCASNEASFKWSVASTAAPAASGNSAAESRKNWRPKAGWLIGCTTHGAVRVADGGLRRITPP